LPGAPPKIPRSDINISDWIRAPKGVTGHEQRQYILKNPTNAAERALRLSRRQGEQAKTGKRIDERRPSKSEAERWAYAFKRRETAAKKREYKNESIKDIRWFERAKEKRRARYIGVKGKEVGGAFTSEDYARLKAMAEKYADLDQDFLKYVSSPVKKRLRGRRLDMKGRSVRDMRTRTRPKTQRKAA